MNPRFSRKSVAVAAVLLLTVFSVIFKSKNCSVVSNVKCVQDSAQNFKISGFEEPFGQNPETDRRLIQHLRDSVLSPPSELEYNLINSEASKKGSNGFILQQVIPKYFPGVMDGVFFEAGALDGETFSTTLYLEMFLGWTGVLAEMNPIGIDKIIQKHRKSWLAPSCLSPTNTASRMMMYVRYDPSEFGTAWGATVSDKKRLLSVNSGPKKPTELEFYWNVPCYPLTAILLATKMISIDFFSLDVEGIELKVLKTINWDIISIKVIHLDLQHTEEGTMAVKEYLASKGFKHVFGAGEPVLFVHESHLHAMNEKGRNV